MCVTVPRAGGFLLIAGLLFDDVRYICVHERRISVPGPDPLRWTNEFMPQTVHGPNYGMFNFMELFSQALH